MAGLDYARAVAFVQLGRPDQAAAACRDELNHRWNPDAERLLEQLGQPMSNPQSIPITQTENQRMVSTM